MRSAKVLLNKFNEIYADGGLLYDEFELLERWFMIVWSIRR